jgi:hypothetical protein
VKYRECEEMKRNNEMQAAIMANEMAAEIMQ